MTFEKKNYGDLKSFVRMAVLSPDQDSTVHFGVFLCR